MLENNNTGSSIITQARDKVIGGDMCQINPMVGPFWYPFSSQNIIDNQYLSIFKDFLGGKCIEN